MTRFYCTVISLPFLTAGIVFLNGLHSSAEREVIAFFSGTDF